MKSSIDNSLWVIEVSIIKEFFLLWFNGCSHKTADVCKFAALITDTNPSAIGDVKVNLMLDLLPCHKEMAKAISKAKRSFLKSH